MKKIFTTTFCALVMMLLGIPINAQTPAITIGEKFTAGGSNSTWYWTNNTDSDQSQFYLVSNSKTDLLSSSQLVWKYWSSSFSFAYGSFTAIESSKGYVYQFGPNNMGTGNTYCLEYSGSGYVDFTMYLGVYDPSSDSGGDDGDVDSTSGVITLDTPFLISPSVPKWNFVTDDSFQETENCYFISTSKVDYLSDLTWGIDMSDMGWGTIPLSLESYKNNAGYYVYVCKATINPGKNYSLEYTGSEPLQLTMNLGDYIDDTTPGDDGGDVDSTSGVIQLDKTFEASPTVPNWTFTAPSDFSSVENYYFVSNSKEDISAYIKWERDLEIFTVPLPLEAKINSDGYYVFLGASTIDPDYKFTFEYTGEKPVQFTMHTGVPDGNLISPAGTIEWDEPFTLSPSSPTWIFYEENEAYASIDAYLVSNSSTDLQTQGTLRIDVNNWNLFPDWDAIQATDGIYGYNGSVNQNTEYVFKYSGSEEVTLTLKKGQYTKFGEPEYMAEGTVIVPAGGNQYSLDLNDIVVEWNNGATLENMYSPGKVNFYLNGTEDVNFVNWYLVDSAALDGTEDDTTVFDVLNAMKIEIPENFTKDSAGNPNPGSYKVVIPAGLVADPTEGKLNPDQTIVRTVLPAAKATVTPVPGAVSYLDEITVTFDGESMALNPTATFNCTLNGQNITPKVEGTTLTFDVSGIEAETYTLFVPGTMYLVDDATKLSEEVNAEFNISFAQATVEPESGSVFDYDENVVITATYTGESIAKNNDIEVPATLSDSNQIETAVNWGDNLSIDEEKMQVVFNFGTELAPGEYILTFVENAVTVDGLANVAIDYTFTVVAPDEMDVEATVLNPNTLEEMEDNAYLTNLNGLGVVWGDQALTLVDSDKAYAIVELDAEEPVNVDVEVLDFTEELDGFDRSMLYLDLDQFAGKTGVFKVTVPFNTVKNADDEVNAEVSWTFNVCALNEDYKIAWLPESLDGGTFKSADLSSAAWNWEVEGEATVMNVQKVLNSGATLENRTTGETTALEATSGKNSFMVMFDDQLAEGNYQLSLPEGAYLFDDNSLSPAYFASFVIDNTPDDMTAEATAIYEADSMNPAVFVVWENEDGSYMQIEAYDDVDGMTAEITTPTGEVVPVDLILQPYGLEEGDAMRYTALMAALGDIVPVYGYGEYSIEIAAGIVINTDGEINKAQTLTFNVLDTHVAATVSQEGNTIYISFDDEALEVYNPYDSEISIIDYSDPDAPRINLTWGENISIVDNKVVVDIEGLGLVDKQYYELYIEEDYFYVGDENKTSAAVSYTFEFDILAGITGISADANGMYRVYNLNGMNVLNTTDARDIKGLAKGLYIINGKKAIIR